MSENENQGTTSETATEETAATLSAVPEAVEALPEAMEVVETADDVEAMPQAEEVVETAADVEAMPQAKEVVETTADVEAMPEAVEVAEPEAAVRTTAEVPPLIEETAVAGKPTPVAEPEAAVRTTPEVLPLIKEAAVASKPAPVAEAAPKPSPAKAQHVGELSPEAMFEEYISRTFKEGEIIKGTIVKIENDSVLVDIGYKSEAIIPMKELSRNPVESPRDVVQEGDVINCYIVKVEDNQGNIVVSKRRADYELAWSLIKKAFSEGTVLEAPVARNVKGGVLVDLGIWGFVPRSQIGSSLRGNKSLVGSNLRLQVIELDEENRKFTCSARKVEDEEKERAKENVFSKVKEGAIVTGKVARITNFGVFVDLGGVDGLIHISELTWGALRHPSKFVAVGQELQAKVLKFTPEEGKISLSLRQVEADPWDKVELKFPVGSTAQGKVVKIGKYGAIVELERGISGLVHISELSDDKVQKPEDVVKVDDDVLVKVINLKKSMRRITLSMKQTELEKETPATRRDRGDRDRGERRERSDRDRGERRTDRGDRERHTDRGDRERKADLPERGEETLGTLGDFWKNLNEVEL